MPGLLDLWPLVDEEPEPVPSGPTTVMVRMPVVPASDRFTGTRRGVVRVRVTAVGRAVGVAGLCGWGRVDVEAVATLVAGAVHALAAAVVDVPCPHVAAPRVASLAGRGVVTVGVRRVGLDEDEWIMAAAAMLLADE